MARKSIANRWFINSFSIVAIFLLIVNITVFFALRNYYYGAVRQYLGTQANTVYGILYYMDDYSPEMRRAIEEFENKNHAELMAITTDGRVDITSGGFSTRGGFDMPDYERAKTSDNGRADYVGTLPNSERYMALTVMLSGNVYDAIRVVSSLDRIDRQINATTLAIAFISAAVMLLVLFLGMYFIKSIVSPLRQIGNSAKKLAAGDFSDRVELSKNDDEIGELCRVFNSMADDLENSEKIKNDFISSVSHELRTPLTAIRGWSETIAETGSDDAVVFDKGMKVITSETTRLSDMVEDLLDFSKMQSGRFKLQKTNMDALAELADAVSVYAERAKKEGTTLYYVEPEEEDFAAAMIFGDKNRIRQVFINIIDNALKYSSPNGMVTVDASAENQRLVINVTDNGCGISVRDLPKVKNRFFKANNSVRGSGIGLAVADEIMALHEGFLDIESEPGKGTTVTITLPTKQKQG